MTMLISDASRTHACRYQSDAGSIAPGRARSAASSQQLSTPDGMRSMRSHDTYYRVAVSCGGDALVSINAVALHRARLVVG